MLYKIKVLIALALLTGSNAALTCDVVCTGSKDFQYTTRVVERLECTVTRSDGFKSYPSGTAKGDFPSVCNGDYCMTQRWSDCSYVDLSVNGKTYSGKGSCEQWELNYTGGLKAYRRSRLSLGCQFQ